MMPDWRNLMARSPWLYPEMPEHLIDAKATITVTKQDLLEPKFTIVYHGRRQFNAVGARLLKRGKPTSELKFAVVVRNVSLSEKETGNDYRIQFNVSVNPQKYGWDLRKDKS